MRVVIDGRMITWTGIGLYTRKLLEGLAELDKTTDYRVLLLPADAKSWQSPGPNFRAEIVDIPPFSRAEQTKLTKDLLGLRPDLVHFPNFNVPANYRGRYVVTIHDLTLIDFKNISRPGLVGKLKYEVRYWAMRFVVRRAAKRAAAIITSTRYVKTEVGQRYHIDATHISVTPLGIDAPHDAKSGRSPLPSPYLLYIGNPYPHKNLGRLVEAFKAVHKSYPDLKLVLVCHAPVGNIEAFYQRLRQQVKAAGLDQTVVFPEYIPSNELADWYSHAAAYVFPSLSEGFGLPAIGAMAQGTPVAVADATSLPEVCGDAAVYFDPLDPDDIARVLINLLSDNELQKRLRSAGPKQAAKYDWRRMAEQTLAVYRSILK